MRKALVETATGLVENIVEIGDGAVWPVPTGYELLPTVGGTADASPGDTWDGSAFIKLAPAEPTRLDVLLAGGPATHIYDTATDWTLSENLDVSAMIARPAADIAADKAELLELLHAKLAAFGNLTWEEMNKMLALERES